MCHRPSEGLVISGDKVFKCPTIRRRVSSEAYKRTCVDKMSADFYKYVSRGASTSRTEVVEGGSREKGPEDGHAR